jgi:hypothetical protein
MKGILFRNAIVSSVLVCLSFAVVACGSNLTGTYSDPSGAFVLELKSGGQANLTFAGQSAPCTYTVNGQSLALQCPGQAGALVLTIQSDGSLAGPPGTLIPALRKSKS